jgi:hypothetical protein
MNWRWRLAWVAFVVVASTWLGIGLWAAILLLDLSVPGETIRDSSTIPLTVSVRPSGNRPIRSVSAEVFGSRDSADYTCQLTIPPETKRLSATQEPFVGSDLFVQVPTGTTTTRIGLLRSSRYFQYKWLVIVAYEDGERAAKLVEIPDLHQDRQVAIEFP